MDGRHDGEFVLDIFQTGSGTSTNMNANEVISNRGIEMMGGERGSRDPIHPNDHVNMGQSSNDVIPTALHIAAAVSIDQDLLPALTRLLGSLDRKAREFDDIVKTGRTHLMDATPVRLGQEFGGWAAQVAHARRRAEAARDALLELPLGGTAVGTGINRHPDMPANAIGRIADECELPFREATNHFEAQGARDAAVEASGQLKAIAVGLTKIANDIRWLASGPRTGLGELRLPALAPGSSIMPGKVNPVMSEMLVMACAQVVGNDAAVALGGLGGTLELNAMIPLIAHNLLQSITLLANASAAFAEKCVDGIEADREACAATVERNLSLATALVPHVGYDKAAKLAKQAHATGRTVREVAEAEGVMDAAALADALDARKMTEPGA
jgi:fumarate hydratase class II